MALIKCPECEKNVSEKAFACPECGYPLSQSGDDANVRQYVAITFPAFEGFSNGCFVYDFEGRELARCRRGKTAVFRCTERMKISIKMSGCFGKPTCTVSPGDRLIVGFRESGKVCISKIG